MCDRIRPFTSVFRDTALETYLLPVTPWERVFQFQRRLAYEMGEPPRRRAALILCEHPTILTVGRGGSRRHIPWDDDELRQREWPMRWTNRGGGCWLQTPGQLAAYPILPLRPTEFGLECYLESLYSALLGVVSDFGIPAARDAAKTGVVVADREIAGVGIAVTHWVAYHGCWLNVSVPPDALDSLQVNPMAVRPATCMLRERRLPVRMAAVRESFIRHFAEILGFREVFSRSAGPLPAPPRKVHVASPYH